MNLASHLLKTDAVLSIASRWKTELSKNTLDMLLGKVLKHTHIGNDKIPCVQVRCRLNDFDEYIKKYFSRPIDLWALDPKNATALGDTVLITKCAVSKRPARSVTHLVDRVIFKYGYIIDPVTKKRVIKEKYEDDITLQTALVKEIIEEPASHDVLLFEEKHNLQWRRLNTRKLISRRELSRHGRLSARQTTKDVSEEIQSDKIIDLVMEESGEDDICPRPRGVSVMCFVKERVRQIAELLQAVDNHVLVSGEVTKGPRTALQRLPRHMRRRAMSYNIKRFPRIQRRFAISAVAASKHRQKPPSRFWRRRPRNLLLNYIRRQRKHIWLETHIWHAKRFRMIQKWGYNLPLLSYLRTFRPTYRDAMHHCVVRDISFLRCFQVIGINQKAIIEPLYNICAPEVGPTFAFKAALDGRFEMPVMLYEPGKYPYGFIAPVRFSWSKNRTDQKYSLAVWTHPSSSKSILSKFINLFKLKKQDEAVDAVRVDKVPRSIDEWRLRNLQIKTDIYVNDEGVKLLDLSDQIVRFRLYGPKSFEILHNVLAVVDENKLEDCWMKEFLSRNHFWRSECSRHSPGELPDGTIFSLLVEDPRLSRPLKKIKPSEPNHCSTKLLDVSGFPLPLNDFWDFEIRKKALEKKMTEVDLQKKRSMQLLPVKTSEAKIPILLIVRNTGRGTLSPFIGLDLIAPSGFGLEFWLALQYGTARAIGLKDQKFLELESNHLNFPADVPDCDAGRNEFKQEYINLQEKYIRQPHNRRLKYWNSLSIKYPFTFQFSELSHDWLDNSSFKGSAYVVRNHRTLIVIEKWLLGKGPAPEEFIMNSAALVPVSLLSTTTGRPQRFALICAPTKEDYMAVAKLSKGEKSPQIVEQPRIHDVKPVFDNEKDEEKQPSKLALEDFISLDVTANEKHISLNSLFPDKEMLRKRKATEKKKRKREKTKKVKRLKNSVESGLKTDISEQLASGAKASEEETMEFIKYNNSCSRPIIGRIVRGDYSFIHGRGFAIGYCCLSALKQLHHGVVLFRNIKSRYYHPARITLLKNQLDL
uniref:Ribonucleases P/MRP protein subunit POP1 n=1 Tax=Setaria digitata TaxID=48799 RepID=A0A915PE04_9BILA